MTRASKESSWVSLSLAVLFVIAVMLSAYTLYSLPKQLLLPAGFEPVLSKTYIIISLTFLLGGIALYVAIRNRREVIVYKEKSAEASQEDASKDEGRTSTISIDSVRASLRETNSDKLLPGFIRAICSQLEAGQGAVYLTTEKDGVRKVELRGGYSMNVGESASISFEFGEGLVGQAAAEGQTLYVDEVPEGYITIISGLGSASPRYLLIVPIKQEDNVMGVMEIASFTAFDDDKRKFAEECAKLLATTITSNQER